MGKLKIEIKETIMQEESFFEAIVNNSTYLTADAYSGSYNSSIELNIYACAPSRIEALENLKRILYLHEHDIIELKSDLHLEIMKEVANVSNA
jgi:hypothetical protein